MRIPSRNIRAKLQSGDRVLGATVQLPSPDAVEIVGYVGFDFVWIDAEHGTMDLGDIATLVRSAEAVGIDSIVRVPDSNPSFIQRVLDSGATGILVPHLRSAAGAAAIVSAAKFPPRGMRGSCPSTRAVGHLTFDWPAAYRLADQDTIVWGLIEDPEGVDDIDKILAVPGLDGIVFGPFDLSQTSGFEGDVFHPKILALHSKVAKAAQDAGVELVSIAGWEPGGLQGILDRNARIVCGGSDRGALLMGLTASMQELAKGLTG